MEVALEEELVEDMELLDNVLCFTILLIFDIFVLFKQERITFHRGANFTIRLVFNGLERSNFKEKSIKE